MVVVSSSTVAEECFTKNDIILADRPKLIVWKHFHYNYTTVTASPYGDHWRNLRRIGATHIFSSSRLNAFTSVRKDEIRRLLLKLSRDSRQGNFTKVELKPLLRDLALNNIVRMVAGKRYFGDEVTNEAEAREFKELIAEIFKSGGVANPVDFFPILNWFGRGFEMKVKELAKRIDEFLQRLIDEHRSQGKTSNSMIDHLLSLQESEPHYYTDEIIKGFILVIS
ncbi:Cytochrome P450 [Corchorus olitorius]|uniref:Cytochrome P450 n=1 Tax=Corchorus olitorius TaxID=93759 RepID=A0A1R3K9T1_9ROSI|nr:Cytochrome P450 [Corchorus olitorius]